MKVLRINKEDLKHNINIIKSIVKRSAVDDKGKSPKIIGVVKGNGYGLGLIEFSKFLLNNGVYVLAVSSVEEALELKKAKLDSDIMLLSGTSIKSDLQKLVNKEVIISLTSFEDVEVLNKILMKKDKIQKVQIKIDTGFNRYGFKYEDLDKLIEILKLNESKKLKIVGTFSHFSYSYSENKEFTQKQFDLFIKAVEKLKKNGIDTGILHICNSSAFLKYPEMRLNAVRIGSAFLGRLQIENKYNLRKIGKLYANICEIKSVKKGDTIGYSCSDKIRKDGKIAIAQIGYIDGVNSGKYNDTFKLVDKIRICKNSFFDIFKDKHIYYKINDSKCRLLGKIGMNHIVLDIKGKDVKINDEIEIDISPLNVNTNIRREYI